MRKIIFTLIGSAAIIAAASQIAAASERHHIRHVSRVPVVATEQIRNANDAIPYRAWSDYSRYSEGGAISAPAGR